MLGLCACLAGGVALPNRAASFPSDGPRRTPARPQPQLSQSQQLSAHRATQPQQRAALEALDATTQQAVNAIPLMLPSEKIRLLGRDGPAPAATGAATGGTGGRGGRGRRARRARWR